MRPSIVLLAASFLAANAVDVTYNWSVDWVWRAPDGFGRPVIGINNQWPPEPINVNLNDRIIIHLTNNLGNQTTALHFHGPNQKNSPQMEGAAAVSQCPIPPGSTFTYDFLATNTGTHWYHSHIGGQYLDGFRAPLIVNNPAAAYMGSFDIAYTMTVSDWYHQQAPFLVNLYQAGFKGKSRGGLAGAEPLPDSTLINDSQDVKFDMVPGKKYLFRIINMGAMASNIIKFEGHTMTIVEMDGVATKPTQVSTINIAVAQRYLVIVEALPNADTNYGIISTMDPTMFEDPLSKTDAYAYLVYDNTKPFPAQPIAYDPKDAINEFVVKPNDLAPILGPVTQNVVLDFDFKMISGISRGIVNGTTYLPPDVPTLYTVISAPPSIVSDPRIYGPNTNTVIFDNPLGIAEIVINNFDPMAHPFHIHGHIAQVVAQGAPGTIGHQTPFDGVYNPVPMRRDVFMVNANSYTIIRFKTGNPGIWLLHCHIEWHIEAGMVMTFVEDPVQIQELNMVVPQDNYDTCKKIGMPYKGNAAGNTVDWFKMNGLTTVPDKNPWGALLKKNRPAKKRDVNMEDTRSWAGRFKF